MKTPHYASAVGKAKIGKYERRGRQVDELTPWKRCPSWSYRFVSWF